MYPAALFFQDTGKGSSKNNFPFEGELVVISFLSPYMQF